MFNIAFENTGEEEPVMASSILFNLSFLLQWKGDT